MTDFLQLLISGLATGAIVGAVVGAVGAIAARARRGRARAAPIPSTRLACRALPSNGSAGTSVSRAERTASPVTPMDDERIPQREEPETGHVSGWRVEEDPERGFRWTAFGPKGSRHGRAGSEAEAEEAARRAEQELTEPRSALPALNG